MEIVKLEYTCGSNGVSVEEWCWRYGGPLVGKGGCINGGIE